MGSSAGSAGRTVTGMSAEPTDVGPRYGGHLRVSDDDRARAVRLLDAAYADGRLTEHDHRTRAGQARQAVTFDDLIPLTRDLVATADVVAAGHGGAVVPRPPVAAPAPSGQQLPSRWEVAVFSGTTRTGGWHVPAGIYSVSLFGGSTLDLTDAVWSSDEITITCGAVFGGLTVIVPDDVEVRDSVGAVLGSVTVKTRSPQGRRVLQLKGFTFCGGITVKPPKRKRR